MASRGRGRGKNPRPGRGGHSSGKSSGGSKTPSNVDELGVYLGSLNDSNFDVYGTIFADMVIGYSTNEERLEEAMNLIFNTTVESRDYALLGAKVCEKIAMPASETEEDSKLTVRSEFRKILLKRFQFEYKQKEQIRKTSIEAWLGIFSFLCAIYAKLRVNNEPITVCGTAILSIIQYHFDQPDVVSDEIDCICSNLKLCGQLLENGNPEKFKKLFTELRKTLISRKTTCQVRCAILEVVELKNMGWEDPKKTLDTFYIDAMADAMAEDELGENYN